MLFLLKTLLCDKTYVTQIKEKRGTSDTISLVKTKVSKGDLPMTIITEEMRYRHKLCEYALKHGVTKTARRYHTNRQFVYRQLEKYDGTVRSLR